MEKSQGAMEYLIIIATVLAVAAVVVIIVSGAAPIGSTQLSLCKKAAAECDVLRRINPSDPCLMCDSACVDTAGNEVLPNATICCKAGMPQYIYEGADTSACVECDDKDDCADVVCKDKDCVLNRCTYTNVANGSSCGTGGICCDGVCSQRCSIDSDCYDDDPCTDDICGGSGCDAACSNPQITDCRAEGDGCCPAGCDSTNDPDCPECTTDAQCNDDDSCTIDECISESCVYTDITICDLYNEDDCCPPTCDFTNDFDCVECTFPDECDAQTCKVRDCVDNTCVYSNADDNTEDPNCAAGQVCCSGACTTPTCTTSDLSGCTAYACKDATGCTDSGKCTASCTYTNKPEGTSCGFTWYGGWYCSGSKRCRTVHSEECRTGDCITTEETECEVCSYECQAGACYIQCGPLKRCREDTTYCCNNPKTIYCCPGLGTPCNCLL